jgi:prevent-host-death family protein
MEVNIHDAKTNLSRLVAAAERGEEVIIARNGKAVVKLVRVVPTPRKARKQMLGSGTGKLWMSSDAFSPATELQVQEAFEADDPLLTGESGHSPGRKTKSP